MPADEMPDSDQLAFANEHKTNRDLVRQRGLDGYRNFKSKPMVRDVMTECPLRGLRTVPREYAHVRNKADVLVPGKQVKEACGRPNVSGPTVTAERPDEFPVALTQRRTEKKSHFRSIGERFDNQMAAFVHTNGAPRRNPREMGFNKPYFERKQMTGEAETGRVEKIVRRKTEMLPSSRADPQRGPDIMNARINDDRAGKLTTKVPNHTPQYMQHKKNNIIFPLR